MLKYLDIKNHKFVQIQGDHIYTYVETGKKEPNMFLVGLNGKYWYGKLLAKDAPNIFYINNKIPFELPSTIKDYKQAYAPDEFEWNEPEFNFFHKITTKNWKDFDPQLGTCDTCDKEDVQVITINASVGQDEDRCYRCFFWDHTKWPKKDKK